MKKTKHFGRLSIIFVLVMCRLAAADEKHDYPLAPMSFEKVSLQDNFWLPRNESLARQYMVSNQLTAADYGEVEATHTHEDDTVAAVVDGRVPDRSDDQNQPRWTSLPFKNRGQNIIFEALSYETD